MVLVLLLQCRILYDTKELDRHRLRKRQHTDVVALGWVRHSTVFVKRDNMNQWYTRHEPG